METKNKEQVGTRYEPRGISPDNPLKMTLAIQCPHCKKPVYITEV